MTEVEVALEKVESVRVVVALTTPLGDDVARLRDQRAVAALLAGTGSTAVMLYPGVPGLAAEVDAAGWEALATSPLVASVIVDGEAPAA